jgi:uncharacterized membrane protein
VPPSQSESAFIYVLYVLVQHIPWGKKGLVPCPCQVDREALTKVALFTENHVIDSFTKFGTLLLVHSL